jgi:hypothetical protein
MATQRYVDLLKQGFMKPRKTPKVKKERPVVACDRCQNWHRKGKHTKPADGGALKIGGES